RLHMFPMSQPQYLSSSCLLKVICTPWSWRLHWPQTPEGRAAFCRAKNALVRVVVGFSHSQWQNVATRRADGCSKLVMFFKRSWVNLGNTFVLEKLFTFKIVPLSAPLQHHRIRLATCYDNCNSTTCKSGSLQV